MRHIVAPISCVNASNCRASNCRTHSRVALMLCRIADRIPYVVSMRHNVAPRHIVTCDITSHPYSCARAGPPQSRFACRLCQCANRYTATYRRTHIPVRGRAHPNHLTRIAEDSSRHAATLHASLRSAERSYASLGKNNRTKTSKAKLRSRNTDRTGKEG